MTCAPVVVMCPSVPVLLATLLVAAPAAGSPLGCRDQSGAAVDWYVLYKLPVIHDTGAPFVSDGVGFLHFSSASTDERWTLSEVSIDDPLSAPGRTLADVYDNPQRDTLIYVFYNDEHPDNSTTGVKGHTKGVVAFDGDQGFWLIHSVPKFPPPPGEQYSYPGNGQTYGQSFLCVTLSSDQLETVAQQLLFNEPYLYATQLAPALEAQYPLMARVIAGERRSEPPWFGVETLPSGDATFTSYAKARDFGDDLYSGLVAPTLTTGLFAETWRNGATETQLPSNCSAVEPVLNVQNITATAAGGPLPFEFGTTKDHSKWAVSDDSTQPWVCVGDVNRMSTQSDRGGGTVCRWDAVLWRLYSQLVAAVEPCSSTGGHRPPARW
ncbi:deoxyribonuclease-2-alpha-like [Amphibalanus amphitrite]|uniref:deoxyribonuclease-2-alpha-like n=1 Tax=Amphibalanus amphitrite TaxID=1232801 RepID=UPI001C90BE13|nr:deoxyribonuclease-2-alpha-like [Amphibalanus amphitrite]